MEKENTIRILILEDDLETLSVLMKNLYILENNLPNIPLPVTVFSEYTQVEDYLNKTDNIYFDIILLDRDCKLGGSFHVLEFNKFGVNKIISISTVLQWNNEAVERGVKKVLSKDHDNIEEWGKEIVKLIENMLINDSR